MDKNNITTKISRISDSNEKDFSMDYSRMDRKRGHVTCENRLAIEGKESFQKFATFEEELNLPCLGLLGSSKTSSHGLILEKMTPAQWNKNLSKYTRDAAIF